MAGWRMWFLVLLAVGCRHRHAPAPLAPRPPMPTAAPVTPNLPPTKPTAPVLEASSLTPAARTFTAPAGETFRRLTEHDCQFLAVGGVSSANLLDDENRIPSSKEQCNGNGDDLRRALRFYSAMEFRNQAAAGALERFFQLTETEARADLLRQGFPLIDDLLTRAKNAKAANVKFPLEVNDLSRQRSQMVSDLEQAEQGSRLVNLDLKRRLGLPFQPETEHLWPAGDFAINATPPDMEEAVNAALADRPELRGLRALHQGLSPETLPDVRDYLRSSILLGQQRPTIGTRMLTRMLTRKAGPDPAMQAELEVRRKQILDLIAERERAVADETRAAVLSMRAQIARMALAQERLRLAEEKLAEAVKKREAKQPGAEFLEPQSRMDWLKAKGEVATEVAAWHQARIRLKAAQGWLVWEAAPNK